MISGQSEVIESHGLTKSGLKSSQDEEQKSRQGRVLKDKKESEREGKPVERSNSRVNKVSHMMRWPRQKDKDKPSANLYVSDTSQV